MAKTEIDEELEGSLRFQLATNDYNPTLARESGKDPYPFLIADAIMAILAKMSPDQLAAVLTQTGASPSYEALRQVMVKYRTPSLAEVRLALARDILRAIALECPDLVAEEAARRKKYWQHRPAATTRPEPAITGFDEKSGIYWAVPGDSGSWVGMSFPDG